MIVLVTLLVLSPKSTSREVWTAFYDPGWNNQGLSVLVGGIVANVAGFLGADSAGE